MAAIKYKVKLAESERTCLNEVSRRGSCQSAPSSGRSRCSKLTKDFGTVR